MLRVHSIQSMGTLDGPGIRFVVFTQGCPLRCKCCHNPDTWAVDGGQEIAVDELVRRACRYKEYFGTQGGITLSGGEPLMQAEAAYRLFDRCRAEGINTCLDTSGCVWNGAVERLLSVTDRVLLDIKYTADTAYRDNVGCSMTPVLAFLDELDRRSIPTTLRQVIIPTVNDDRGNILALRAIRDSHPCVDGVELLGFRTLCHTKYETLSIPFPFGHLPEPTRKQMDELRALL